MVSPAVCYFPVVVVSPAVCYFPVVVVSPAVCYFPVVVVSPSISYFPVVMVSPAVCYFPVVVVSPAVCYFPVVCSETLRTISGFPLQTNDYFQVISFCDVYCMPSCFSPFSQRKQLLGLFVYFPEQQSPYKMGSTLKGQK